MKRHLAIAACGLSLAACSSMPGWMQFDVPSRRARAPPPCSSNPSRPAPRRGPRSGQTCRTPCSLAVAATEFTVSFTLPGYQPQTVPVRAVDSTDPVDADAGQTRRPAAGAEPGVRGTAAGRRPRPRPAAGLPRRSKPQRPRGRPRNGAERDDAASRAGPRAGLALAAAAVIDSN